MLTADILHTAWERLEQYAAIRPGTARARRFASFGEGSSICFPQAALFGEEHIELGAGCIVGPYCSMSTGIMPGATGGRTPRLKIGDGSLIGMGSGIVTHELIELGNDVFLGHYVYVTDSSHGYEDLDTPIGKQFGDVDPVRIGEGTWLGHGTIPDFSVAVGTPASVIRRYSESEGWHRVHEQRVHVDHHKVTALTPATDTTAARPQVARS